MLCWKHREPSEFMTIWRDADACFNLLSQRDYFIRGKWDINPISTTTVPWRDVEFNFCQEVRTDHQNTLENGWTYCNNHTVWINHCTARSKSNSSPFAPCRNIKRFRQMRQYPKCLTLLLYNGSLWGFFFCL